MNRQDAAHELHADGITLEPLRVEHADEMVGVLGDATIYEYIGGEPPSLETLRARYCAQVIGGSPDGRQTWLNWVIRIDTTGEAAGYVQATVESVDDEHQAAEVAWVVAPSYQGRGLAKSAAATMCRHLRACGTDVIGAFVHPDHAASNAVARSIGLEPTASVVDGEIQWTNDRRASADPPDVDLPGVDLVE